MKANSKGRDKLLQTGYLAPLGPHAHARSIVSVIVLAASIGGLFIGLVADKDFRPVILAVLLGAALIALWFRHSENSFAASAPASNRPPKSNWDPQPQHLVPFGPYGVGQITAHPIGLVIVIGLLLMGLVAPAPVGLLVFFSLLCGSIVGFFLWLHHR